MGKNKSSMFYSMRGLFQNADEHEFDKERAERLIYKFVRYFEKYAKDVMTHRRDIIALDEEMTLGEALSFMFGENFSRFPIYHETIDEITGIIHLKDAMECYFNGGDSTTPIKELPELIRPVSFIPETKFIHKLFKQMQDEKNHIAIVLDEYGQTSGLVALEDILETIVGNILDEHDDEDQTIVTCADGSYETEGLIALEELEDLLGISFEKEDYETLNGFMIAQTDRIPSDDEICMVEYEGYRFTSLEIENNTIESVKIEKINK